MRPFRMTLLSLITYALVGCSQLSQPPTSPITVPPVGTIAPAAEVRFMVSAPPGTLAEAELALVLLDPVTELDLNTRRIPMKSEGNRQWSATLTPTVDTMLYYRFEKNAPDAAIEVTTQGSPVDFRTAYITGPGEIHEMIARWSGEDYQGETGRILGQIISDQDDQSIPEIVISAAGNLTFTDGEGRFRFDGLPPGVHTLTAFSPTGSFLPQKQEALVASSTTTPAVLKLKPAEPVLATFQVKVPADTPEHATLRLAGNLAQLGFRFTNSDHSSHQSIAQMPALVRVDPEHFLGVFTLYSGTNLYYKYTLGDGVWNAERGKDGSFITRSMLLKGENPTVWDTVTSWSDSSGEPTRFEVSIPEYTPPGDHISIQFHVDAWRAPLPMWGNGSNWSYVLYSPASLLQDLEYRYCRNMQCGAADEAVSPGPDSAGRPIGEDLLGTLIQDVVDDWSWLDQTALQSHDPAFTGGAENPISGGVEILDDFDPSWMPYVHDAFVEIGETGADQIILTPAWVWVQNNPFPILELDPTRTAMDQELQQLSRIAQDAGMSVSVRPSFHNAERQMDTWWQQAKRDQHWWDLWFEEYRSFILTYARWAEHNRSEALILGGPEVFPALPLGSLPDGSPSGVPVDSETRWRTLIGEVRSLYGGQLAFELEVIDGLSPVPPFLDLVDHVHLFWHSPLIEAGFDSDDVLLAAVEAQINTVLNQRAIDNKPITISIAYLSLENSASACPLQADSSCRPLSDFSRGSVVDIDLEIDLQAQAQIYDAFSRAIADKRQIEGLFARDFYPAVILHDKSASIYGKPAQAALRSWFTDLSTVD